MASSLDAALAAELAGWEARGLRRELAPIYAPGDAPADATVDASAGASRLCDFTSNDYLSLARDARVIEAARDALARYGVGGRAARLLGGGSPLDASAEAAAADWLGAEAALLFPSGYQANLGVVGALAHRGDAVISDERNHASLIDAAVTSRARVLVHGHLDLPDVERCLRAASGARRRLVLTESVFSMDGDAAPLGALHELCARYDAWLVVDEAHAIGLVGGEGAGGWAAIDADGRLARGSSTRLAARIVTGGKALGSGGAFVVGSQALREHLVNQARSFVFTTAPSPALSGALVAAIAIARAADERRESVRHLAHTLANALDRPEPAAAIVPWIAGANERALAIAAAAVDHGFDVRAIRPPTVPEGSARLRLVCHAHNDEAEIDRLAALLSGDELAAPLLSRPDRLGRPEAIALSREGPLAKPASAIARACLRPLFVAGTDTGVGKTVVAALLARAAARGGAAVYWKPVQTGSESDTGEVQRLAATSGALSREPAYRFALPAAPDEAARAAHAVIDLARLQADLEDARQSAQAGVLLVELAGGLLVPYDDSCTQLDWLAREAEPLVIVARSGLGTLNHTLLSLEALEARRLRPRALFLVGARHAANRTTLEQRSGGLPIYEVEPFEPLEPQALERWIDAHDLTSVLGEHG